MADLSLPHINYLCAGSSALVTISSNEVRFYSIVPLKSLYNLIPFVLPRFVEIFNKLGNPTTMGTYSKESRDICIRPCIVPTYVGKQDGISEIS